MLGHWYTLLFTTKQATKATGSHGTEKPMPQMTAHEVDRFSDFPQKPKVRRNDDDETMLIFMMQGA